MILWSSDVGVKVPVVRWTQPQRPYSPRITGSRAQLSSLHQMKVKSCREKGLISLWCNLLWEPARVRFSISL